MIKIYSIRISKIELETTSKGIIYFKHYLIEK